MRLTKYGHSCLLVEEGPARLLLDPGTLSGGFEELEGLTAVLVTHQHADHLDLQRLRTLLHRNPGARVLCDEGSAEQLAAAGAAVEVVHDGEELDVGGVAVRVSGRDPAVIHSDIPVVPNVGYLVGGRLFHPGDAFTPPGRPVEVLAVPAGEIVADPGRGLLMGNRGCLHGPDRRLGVARWRSKLWICCVLDWKGVRRDPMPPGRWTVLFFLDEATALAAGHRPCAYCRRADFVAF